jgi:truncated hemoglobin YjbI
VKFGAYITHLTGGSEAYEGRSMEEAHKHFPITDEIFDAFNGHCVLTLKLKLKITTHQDFFQFS